MTCIPSIIVTQNSPSLQPKGGVYTANVGVPFGPLDIRVEEICCFFLGPPPGIIPTRYVVVEDENPNFLRLQGTPTQQGTFQIYRGANCNGTITLAGTILATVTVGPRPTLSPSVTSLPPGQKGRYYLAQLAAVSSFVISPPHSSIVFSFSGLPAGLFGGTTGLITGVPQEDFVSGTSFLVTISSNYDPGTATAMTIVIYEAPPLITNIPSTGLQLPAITGSAFSFQVEAPDIPVGDTLGAHSAATSFSLEPQTTPPNTLISGVTLDTSTGLISGTVTATPSCGVDAFTSFLGIKATNNTGDNIGTGTPGSNVKPLSIFVSDPRPPTVSPATLGASPPYVYVNLPMTSFQVVASRCPTSFSATGLPPGVSISTAGIISGTPTGVGTFVATVTASNAYGSGSDTVTITVSLPACVITNPVPNPDPNNPCENTVHGEVFPGFFSFFITATNSPTTFTATPLPAGLSLNSTTGEISGPPGAPGSTTVTVTADNAGPDPPGSSLLNIVIHAAGAAVPAITSDLDPRMDNGIAAGIATVVFEGYQITATNCPTSFGASSLPPGLTVNAVTGLISGTPTTPGIYTSMVSATNAFGTGPSSSVNFIISFLPPSITSPLAAYGVIGELFAPPNGGYTITATNSPTLFGADSLPAGLSINTLTGAITGTVDSGFLPGVYTVPISASNAGLYGLVPSQPEDQEFLILTIYSGPPAITSISPDTVSTSGGEIEITGINFRTGARVLIGNIKFSPIYQEATSVIVESTMLMKATVPAIAYIDIGYDVVVVNPDSQSGVLPESLFVIAPGTSPVQHIRYSSLYSDNIPVFEISSTGGPTNRKGRIFGLGTNVEVLHYSGIDGNKLLNVYRKQMGTTSTRHAEGDLVFKGMTSIQLSPFSFVPELGDGSNPDDIERIAHLECILRSDGKIEMKVRTVDGYDFSEITKIAYASYQAVLIKSLAPLDIPLIGTADCEEAE
jgi:hypothetical protein